MIIIAEDNTMRVLSSKSALRKFYTFFVLSATFATDLHTMKFLG